MPSGPGLTRRALLGAAGAAALTAVAGCNPFSTGGKTITVTTQAPPPTTQLLGLVFKTRLHIQDLQAAIAVDKRDAKLLTPLLHDRQAHLVALQAEYARSVGETSAATTPVPTTGVTLPNKDPDEVIGVIRGDAATAQSLFTDAMTTAESPYAAQLFASIAACMATHRVVLA